MIEKPINSPDYKNLPLDENILVNQVNELLDVNITLRELQDRIHLFPERERIVIALKFFGGISERGISKMIKKSIKTVKRTLRNIEERLE